MSAPYPTFRSWMRRLADSNRLSVAREGVALEFGVAALAKRMDGEKAVLFPNPDGHPVPVVSGLVSVREWIAEAMGVPLAEMHAHYRKAAESPIPWREVPRAEAPAQQVVIRERIDLRRILPIPRHNEHDSAPYITAGLVIARNPRTGIQNVSINRIQINAADRAALLILPRHLAAFFADAEAMGQPLPIAIVIGVDPLTLLASQAITPIDHDELEVAGALHGGPLPVVKCVTNEVRVPAHAEIVIEACLLPGVREEEGPFGEFPRYYSPKEKREVFQVDCVTHRQDPVYHTIVPAALEHLLLGAIPREATLLAHLKRSFPNVTAVHLAIGGTCRYHLYVQMKKTREGEPKNVIMGAFAGHYDVKHVIVVDEDVDVNDPGQVEWAVATRFQADRDLVVVPGALGSVLDPSTDAGISAKMGMDATRPLKYEGYSFTRIHIPGEDTVDPARELSAPDPGEMGRVFRE